jgi:hypoxanthine phosphoribosyltransferase
MSSLEITLAVISVVSFVGALPQVWGQSWKDVYKYHVEKTLRWSDIVVAYKSVVAQMNKLQFSPIAIIGIGRGGIIAAGLICSELINSEIVEDVSTSTDQKEISKVKIGVINSSIKLRSTKPTLDKYESKIDTIRFSLPSISLNPTDKVLLVIAQQFTGNSLNDSIKILVDECKIPRENIRTAALIRYSSFNYFHLYHTPDFVGLITKENKNVPWKIKENNTNRY